MPRIPEQTYLIGNDGVLAAGNLVCVMHDENAFLLHVHSGFLSF